jgi:hypothetical protein
MKLIGVAAFEIVAVSVAPRGGIFGSLLDKVYDYAGTGSIGGREVSDPLNQVVKVPPA